jgi:hypothetical protein
MNSAFNSESEEANITSTKNNNIYTVLYDYVANQEDEISLDKGTQIMVLSKDPKVSGDEGWWMGVHLNSNDLNDDNMEKGV